MDVSLEIVLRDLPTVLISDPQILGAFLDDASEAMRSVQVVSPGMDKFAISVKNVESGGGLGKDCYGAVAQHRDSVSSRPQAVIVFSGNSCPIRLPDEFHLAPSSFNVDFQLSAVRRSMV